jgi:hypothetical protein
MLTKQTRVDEAPVGRRAAEASLTRSSGRTRETAADAGIDGSAVPARLAITGATHYDILMSALLRRSCARSSADDDLRAG